MQLDLNTLPTDPELLQRLVRDVVATIEHRDSEIERLKSIIKQLQRMQFGRRSERLDPDQLALALEDIDSDIGRIKESRPTIVTDKPDAPPRRKPLPDHLPREHVRLDIDDMICACCGGALHVLWGGFVATALAMPFNTAFFQVVDAWVTHHPLVTQRLGADVAEMISAPISAPITEELAKALGVTLIFVLLRGEFDSVRDGLVYGALVGAGFNWYSSMTWRCERVAWTGWTPASRRHS